MDITNQYASDVQIGEHGFVKPFKSMGSDEMICHIARVGGEPKQTTEGLIRYMMRHRHTSPFEFVQFIFHVSCPIFVARQWFRHRTGSFSEISARYRELPENYWTPKQWRGQSKSNHQGSQGVVDYTPAAFQQNPSPYNGDDKGGEKLKYTAEELALWEYRRRLTAGVAREQARSCLPLSIYTEFYWRVDLHNLLHFLDLRDDSHAQPEIQEYAAAIREMIRPVVPVTMKAWEDYRKNAVTFSAGEIDCLINRGRTTLPPREVGELMEKLRKSGFSSAFPSMEANAEKHLPTV